jgi:hypothetical protein
MKPAPTALTRLLKLSSPGLFLHTVDNRRITAELAVS